MYFSTWLIPTGKEFELLQAEIARLSKKYSTALFEPHVTLTGGFQGIEPEVAEKAQSLAESLDPYRLSLEELGFADDFFRALYIRCKPTDEVESADRLARNLFSLQNVQSHFFHLSLLYGRFTTEEKLGMLSEIRFKLPISFEASSLHLFRMPGNDPRAKEKICEFPFGRR
jgi:2'-5' RNA ligase